MENGRNPKLEAAIGTSIKEDPREAGIEVAEKTLKNFKGKIDFFLLFVTAHYEKNKGYQKLLDGLWEILPEGVRLVGGVFSGFINHDGVYAKGVTALACSYPNMDVTVSFGENVKRNPKRAALQCAKMIKDQTKNKYDKKIIFSFISGGELPKASSSKGEGNIKSKIKAKIILKMFSFFQKVMQKGLGNEQEFLEYLSEEIPDFSIIHGSMINNLTLMSNYQFLDKKVLKETALALTIEIDRDFELNYANATERFSEDFIISEISKDKRVIKKINNKPAFKELRRIMSWTDEYLNQQLDWMALTSKYPIAFEENGKIYIRTISMILGDYIGTMGKINSKKAFIGSISQTKMIDSIDEVIKDDNPDFGFLVSCIARQGFLGIKVYQIQEKLKKHFKEKPFLLLYTGGEGMRKLGGKLEYLNESITSFIIKK